MVALANLAYFFVEFAVAQQIGSVSLVADSIDFLEDTTSALLIFFALRWALGNGPSSVSFYPEYCSYPRSRHSGPHGKNSEFQHHRIPGSFQQLASAH
jgi:hypothetical protein